MKRVALFLLLMGFWLIFTFSLRTDHLVAGVLVSLLVTLVFGKYFVGHAGKLLEPKRYAWALLYAVVFLWECVKANFDVAYRVLHPAMPIKPGIVKVKLHLQNELARAMLANSITMTPGTITMDIIGDYIYIHWINVYTDDVEEYSRHICGKFEKYISKIFE